MIKSRSWSLRGPALGLSPAGLQLGLPTNKGGGGRAQVDRLGVGEQNDAGGCMRNNDCMPGETRDEPE